MDQRLVGLLVAVVKGKEKWGKHTNMPALDALRVGEGALGAGVIVVVIVEERLTDQILSKESALVLCGEQENRQN